MRALDMIGFSRPVRLRLLRLAALGGVGVGLVAFSAPAHAWWRGGFVVGVVPPPLYFGPPVVYPPPVVYAPPPVVYAPPPTVYTPPNAYAGSPAPGQTCYAGAYVCPLPQPFPPGSSCSCPDNSGRRAFGQAR
jgi:hypothetical protein